MEEQESAVTILLDASASMAEKWELARQAAETAAYLALTGGDRLRVYLVMQRVTMIFFISDIIFLFSTQI